MVAQVLNDSTCARSTFMEDLCRRANWIRLFDFILIKLNPYICTRYELQSP